jgi:hypothetical protein
VLDPLEEVAGKAGDLVELLDRPEPAAALAVSEDPPGLGDREPGIAELLEAGAVEVDRVSGRVA